MSRPRSQRVTVRDLAAETGVSIATVSRVLNNQAHVAPQTRELIQRAAERLSGQAPGPRMVPARVFPFVVVDPRAPMPRDIAAVSAAHFTGARSISRHLVDLGHRRVGVIAGPHNWLASDARLAGHASALANVGVLPDPELVRSGEPTAQFGYHAAGELLDRPQRPTALIGFNDKVAVGALAAAAQRGLRSGRIAPTARYQRASA